MNIEKFCVKCLREVAFDTTEHLWGCECFATRTVQTGEFDFDLEFVPNYWIETSIIPQMIKELSVEKIIALMKEIYPGEKYDRLGVMLRLDGTIAIYYKPEFQNPDVSNVFLSVSEFSNWLQTEAAQR